MNFQRMSGNFLFQPDEAGMFGPNVFFLLISWHFRLQYCQGNLYLGQGNVREFWLVLNV